MTRIHFKATSPVQVAIFIFLLFYLSTMSFLTLFRVGFIAFNVESFDFFKTLKALWIGLKFDGLITGFVLAIPFLVVVISSFFNLFPKKFKIFINGWLFTLIPIIFTLTAADIPYFAYFHDHLNIEVFGWFAFLGDTLGMIFQDWHNYLYLFVLILIIFLYVKLILWIEKKVFTIQIKKLIGWNHLRDIPLAMLASVALFFSMRGTFELYPLRVGKAYFCNDAFYNRVGIAPTFNIIESIKNKDNASKEEIDAVDLEEALLFVQNEFGIDAKSSDYDENHPLRRKVVYDKSEATKQNVVVVLLESLCADDVDLQFDGRPLMPFLSSLRDSCLFFPHFYSGAIHTNCGITSTLFGYAPNFAKPTMNIPSDFYSGLPKILKQNGYSTLFFITGNPQYDRMNSFLYDNNIDVIYSQYDYPAEKIVNNFGVQDDYMLQFGLKTLTKESEKGKPFFATFLTVSNHPPYIVPEEFVGVGTYERESMLAYVDHTVADFLKQARQTEWGRNTIFVLLGDHGYLRKPQLYDMSLTCNHIPCYIVKPDNQSCKVNEPCSQLDITATVMGLLKTSYTNNTMGQNVLEQKREYAFFVNDNQIGCVDDTYFYCYNFNSKREFLYRIGESTDYSVTEKEKTAAMRNYAFSMMAVNNAAVRKKWCE